ncbi:hypothetical protein WMY93_000216 [Mugilogobius chulae]|uniref:Uncharacterized protein n=1 Tax=Mugilogobius chulae TaxID=88201 RepID=A0AAW0Q096_9GOBI
MSKSQALRDLINERLTAAVDEIFALFESTIAEYERELSYYKQQNQKNHEVLFAALTPKVVLLKVEEITPVIKEEPEEHEEVHLQELSPQFPSVCVKKEEAHCFNKVRKSREKRIL